MPKTQTQTKKIDIQVRLPISNMGFTYKDENRPYFTSGTDSVANVKKSWVDTHFSQPVKGGYNELSTLNAIINLPITDVEKTRTINYLMVIIDGVEKFYFVESVKIANSRVATFYIKLDSITTYLDSNSFGGFAKVERKHFDRFKPFTSDNILAGKNLEINMASDSGIWNEDSNIDVKPTFVNSNPLNINDYDDTLYKEYKQQTSFFNGLMGYALLEKSGTFATDGNLGLQLTTQQTNTGNTTDTGILINPIGVRYSWGLLGSNYGLQHYPDNDLNHLHLYYLSQIISIFTLPLPLYKLKEYKTKIYDTDGSTVIDKTVLASEVRYVAHTEKDTNSMIFTGSSTLVQHGMDGSGAYIEETNGSIQHRTSVHHSDIELSKVGVNVLTKPTKAYDYNREPKLYTSKFLDIMLRSFNGQNTKLINEFIISNNNDKLEFEHRQSLGTSGGYLLTNVDNNTQYKEQNKTGRKTFVVSYKDQIPNASSRYLDYMKTSGNEYRTGIANNRTSSIVGGLSSLIGGALLAPLTGGASIVGGLQGGASALTSGINNDKMFSAKIADLKNQGTTTEINDTSIFKDIHIDSAGEFGDTSLAIYGITLTENQRKEVSSYYNKYGYISGVNEKISSYRDLETRKRFSYWQFSNIQNAMSKDNIPVEALHDINMLFNQGIRLWHWIDHINDYSLENWELGTYVEFEG